MEIRIPFSGFYNSWHEEEINCAVESLVQDSRGDPYPSLSEKIWDEINYPKVHEEYAKNFVEDFQAYFNEETDLDISLTFKDLSSPKSYNFTTDRIFAEVSEEDVKKLWKKVDKKILEKRIADTYTSYDGFMSYYSNSLESWQDDPSKWDHNQLCTLLEAVMLGAGVRKDWETEIVENLSENNFVGDILWQKDSLSPEGERIVKIASYLRGREDRMWRRL